MRVLHLSDLHLDINQRMVKHGLNGEVIELVLVRWLNKQRYDVLLISGDLTNRLEETCQLLDYIKRETSRPVYFVPGNHDFYDTAHRSLEASLDVYRNHDSVILDRTVSLTEDVELVGALGWYDYEYRPKGMLEIDAKRMKPNLWVDARYIYSKKSDVDMAKEAKERTKRLIESVKDKKIWLMTHFVPHHQFIISKNDPIWNMCNSYMGSKLMEDLIRNEPSIHFVSFGHTHHRFGLGRIEEKTYISNPLGYVDEWKTNSIQSELDSLKIIIDL